MGRESLISVIGKYLGRIRVNFQAVRKVLLLVLRLILIVAGLAFVCAAAWVVAVPLGLFTIGASLLILEWVVKR